MELEVIKWLSQQNAGLAIAALLFFFYRRDVKNGINSWRTQTEILLRTIDSNTKVMTEIVTYIHSMNQIVEECKVRREGHVSASDSASGLA